MFNVGDNVTLISCKNPRFERFLGVPGVVVYVNPTAQPPYCEVRFQGYSGLHSCVNTDLDDLEGEE